MCSQSASSGYRVAEERIKQDGLRVQLQQQRAQVKVLQEEEKKGAATRSTLAKKVEQLEGDLAGLESTVTELQVEETGGRSVVHEHGGVCSANWMLVGPL